MAKRKYDYTKVQAMVDDIFGHSNLVGVMKSTAYGVSLQSKAMYTALIENADGSRFVIEHGSDKDKTSAFDVVTSALHNYESATELITYWLTRVLEHGQSGSVAMLAELIISLVDNNLYTLPVKLITYAGTEDSRVKQNTYTASVILNCLNARRTWIDSVKAMIASDPVLSVKYQVNAAIQTGKVKVTKEFKPGEIRKGGKELDIE